MRKVDRSFPQEFCPRSSRPAWAPAGAQAVTAGQPARRRQPARAGFARRPRGIWRCSSKARSTGSTSSAAIRATTSISRRWPTSRRASTAFPSTKPSRGPTPPRRSPTRTSIRPFSTRGSSSPPSTMATGWSRPMRPASGRISTTAVMARDAGGPAESRRRLAEPPAAAAVLIQQRHVHGARRPRASSCTAIRRRRPSVAQHVALARRWLEAHTRRRTPKSARISCWG